MRQLVYLLLQRLLLLLARQRLLLLVLRLHQRRLLTLLRLLLLTALVTTACTKMDALEQSIQAGLSQEPCLFLGFGIGLRPCHYQTILDHCPPDIDWFEIVSEDYMVPGGTPLHYLDAIA